jgi:acetyl esterase/lipase
MIEQSQGIISRAFALEHRRASSAPFPAANHFPAALLDALAGYRYLVDTLGFDPHNIIVAGDSSGGQLALMLVRYLIAAKLPSLSPPGALILVSPTADWGRTQTGTPSSTLDANEPTDIVGMVLRSDYTPQSILGKLNPSELSTNAWFSPGSLKLPDPAGVLAGFPPTLVLASSAEQIVDGIRVLRDRLIADNGKEKVTYVEYPHAFHVWLAYMFHEPERTSALGDVRRFLSQVYGA